MAGVPAHPIETLLDDALAQPPANTIRNGEVIAGGSDETLDSLRKSGRVTTSRAHARQP